MGSVLVLRPGCPGMPDAGILGTPEALGVLLMLGVGEGDCD